jgi:predicted deacylase
MFCFARLIAAADASECEYVFDFHSGGSSLIYVPSALMRRPQNPEALAQGIEMLRTFGY